MRSTQLTNQIFEKSYFFTFHKEYNYICSLSSASYIMHHIKNAL